MFCVVEIKDSDPFNCKPVELIFVSKFQTKDEANNCIADHEKNYKEAGPKRTKYINDFAERLLSDKYEEDYTRITKKDLCSYYGEWSPKDGLKRRHFVESLMYWLSDNSENYHDFNPPDIVKRKTLAVLEIPE